jgi:YD repeat-containing protein
VYGTTLAHSEIASSRLLREVIYPDSTSGTDRVKHCYTRQGEVIETTDQNQTERAFDYDPLGRRTQGRVVTLRSSVDGSVRRMETAFNKPGRSALHAGSA